MVLGLGTDLVELPRLEAAWIRQGQALLERLFTERERALLAADGPPESSHSTPLEPGANQASPDGERCRHPARLQRLGVRFAAKEAAFKALGTGWGRGVGWHDVEILGGRGEAPVLELHGAARRRMEALGATRALVTLTHTDSVASATVLLV
ncbi:MAG: holo-ACP synthase [Planctomycetota bacterium]